MSALAPEQVRELNRQWQAWGCAICGQTASEDAEPGWRIELHHIGGRPSAGAGGPWAIEPGDVVGLCGELLPGRHHWAVTNARMIVDRTSWVDRETGETGLLRHLPSTNGYVAIEEGAPLPMRPDPAQRFDWLRATIGRTRREMILVALELARAYAEGDYQRLGVDWPTYYGNLGLSKSQVSKMLAVAHAFGSRPLELPADEQRELSVERLYLGKRLVDKGADPEDALRDAVHHPTEQLLGMVRGEEPADRHPCPTCGKWHVAEAS